MIPAYKDKNKGTWYASFYYENWMAIKEMKINRCFAAKREVLISRATTICEIRSQDVITWKNEMLNHRDKDGKSYSPIYLKTPKSNCVIQMPAFLCEKIQEYIKTLYTVRPTDRIFSVTKSYLYREIERGSKAAGVKRIRIHDLRHSHISLLIDMVFSALAITDRVGHESIGSSTGTGVASASSFAIRSFRSLGSPNTR